MNTDNKRWAASVIFCVSAFSTTEKLLSFDFAAGGHKHELAAGLLGRVHGVDERFEVVLGADILLVLHLPALALSTAIAVRPEGGASR